jgi:predicted NodU family carbamoyl transferase
MPKAHRYVLGLNAYDHDVSACLLRDGAIAFAIARDYGDGKRAAALNERALPATGVNQPALATAALGSGLSWRFDQEM